MSAKKPVVPKSRAEQKLAAFHDEDNIDKSYDFQLLVGCGRLSVRMRSTW
jgi:hypothetical protein